MHAHAQAQAPLQLCMAFLRDCMPLKLKALLVLDEPRSLDLAWALIRPFMGAKIASRVSFLGHDATRLHAAVGGPGCVPKELFRGDHPDFGQQWWQQVLQEAAAQAQREGGLQSTLAAAQGPREGDGKAGEGGAHVPGLDSDCKPNEEGPGYNVVVVAR